MGHNCCVPFCHADSVRHKRLKFYVIPKDAVLRRQWVGRIRNENLRSHARVCSLHFEGGVKSYGEIPSIFPWKGNWERIVNGYNDSSRAQHYLAMQVDPNAKPPAMLTLNRPASASKPCVARQHRSVVRTSTPEKIEPLDHLDVSGIEPEPGCSGVSRQILNEEPEPPQDLSELLVSDTNHDDTKPDRSGMSLEQDATINSTFRPYYESTFLLTSDDLQDLLRWVEYWISCDSNDDVDVAKNLMRVLLKLLRNVCEQCDTLKALRQVSRFSLSRFEGSDQDIRFWTGFYSHDALIVFWKHYIEPNTHAISYWGNEKSDWMEDEDKPGPKRKLLPIDEMFLTLVKLKRGSANRDLGERFGIHETHVSRIIVTWIKLLHTVLSEIPIWIQRSKIRKHLPKCFQTLYKDIRVETLWPRNIMELIHHGIT